MDISTFFGTHKPSSSKHDCHYEGTWWRFDGEIHWKVTVNCKGVIARTSTGKFKLLDGESPEDGTRKGVLVFIDGADWV